MCLYHSFDLLNPIILKNKKILNFGGKGGEQSSKEKEDREEERRVRERERERERFGPTLFSADGALKI